MPLIGTDRLSYPAHNVCAMTRQEVPEPLRTLSADLPAGRLMYPSTDGRSTGASQVPVMWLSGRPPDDADMWWRSLYRDRSATGLYPLLYRYHDDHLRPGDVKDASSTDAESWFLEMWDAYQQQKAEWTADEPPPAPVEEDASTWPGGSPTFDAWPGLAATPVRAGTPDDSAAAR